MGASLPELDFLGRNKARAFAFLVWVVIIIIFVYIVRTIRGGACSSSKNKVLLLSFFDSLLIVFYFKFVNKHVRSILKTPTEGIKFTGIEAIRRIENDEDARIMARVAINNRKAKHRISEHKDANDTKKTENDINSYDSI